MSASGMAGQTLALFRRYLVVIQQSPKSSLVRLLVWPVAVIGLMCWSMTSAGKETAPLLTFALVCLTYFNIYSISLFLIKDRESGMKSLMLSMGLRRSAYNLVNALCVLFCNLPSTLILTILSIIYVFQTSQTSAILIFLLFVLFNIHLTGVLLVFVSIITSTKYAAIVSLFIITESLTSSLWSYWISKVDWKHGILFLSSISPYQTIRVFSQSFKLDQNEGILDNPGGDISQPTYLIFAASIFWTVMAYAFALWFDVVCPWQSDIAPRGPFFCCESSPKEEEENLIELTRGGHSNKFFERETHQREVGISLNQVSKSFYGVPAVNNVTFAIHKGETTLLLGHNGAGKSTLMNIILKLIRSDSGKVKIKGARGEGHSIGVCPQTSVLAEELNVRQHLELFHDIKCDARGLERKQQIRKTIEDVSLTSHVDKLPPELSGGMKRKLSLALAFVGKSDVLILDEPSSGLDPDSRVFVWNAIRRYRTDRTVLLSTQHMEEADYLGDRIAIMSSGQIVCCGSSLFLTKLFGTGYKLRIECPASERAQILDYVRKYFAQAKPTEDHQSIRDSDPKAVSDFVIELKGNDQSGVNDSELQLIKLLEDLENNSSSLKIKSYGLKSSSIEDVMLHTSKYFSNSHPQPMADLSSHLTNPQRLSSDKGVCGLFVALLLKHLHTYRAHWKLVIFYRIFIPIAAAFSIVSSSFVSTMNDLSQTYSYAPNLIAAMQVFHYIYFPTQERVSGFKTMQLTSRASFVLYWLAQVAIDLVSVLIMALALNLFVLTSADFQITYVWKFHLIITCATFMFGLSAMMFSYFLSTIFTKSKACTGYMILIYSISLLTWLVTVVIKTLLYPRDQSNWLNILYRVIFISLYPTDAYQSVIDGTRVDCYIGSPLGGCLDLNPFISPLLFGLLALGMQTLLYGSLLFVFEAQNFNFANWVNKLDLLSCFSRQDSVQQLRQQAAEAHANSRELDQDVAAECTKAESLINNVPSDTYSLVAANLVKSYVKRVRVVENLSFTVERSECFGLLGVNGAGKSTTFSMLVAENKQDSGKIWALGRYNLDNVDAYRESLGYDPQTNPEMALSPQQALQLMAKLRGVEDSAVAPLISAILELLEMGQHAHKPSETLSGGTQRKLSLGMAIIGNPNLIILDEPTAGVDPVARRGVWQLLRSLRGKSGSSIVISSHAMEECEAICDRISIMARGRLRCIGTFSHLRSKFACGCTLRVQLSGAPPTELSASSRDGPMGRRGRFSGSSRRASNLSGLSEQVVSELSQRLDAAIGSSSFKLADRNVNNMTFNIVDNRVRRSLIFKVMRDFRKRFPNISYIVNDSSLEDIFISLAREQQELEASLARA